MAKSREIGKRIKAVGNISRITKTMQMIATAKFAASQQRATATKPYTEGLFELVRELAETAGNVSHPLISGPTKRSAEKELTLVITSDRGLCGPYNAAVLRTTTAHFRSAAQAKGGFVEVVGKKGASFFKYAGVPVSRQHVLGDKPSYEAVESLARDFMDRFTSGQVSAVQVVSMRFLSLGRQVPTVTPLLPLKPVQAAPKPGAIAKPAPDAPGAPAPKTQVLYEFSPPAEQLLADLLPAAVKATLFQIFNEAIVSEHIARMVAMKAATDNAKKMGKLLTRKFNRARQTQITTELSEIIGGAAALG